MIAETGILLSTAFFGPVSYFSYIAAFPNCTIEQHEHFIKQSYRNRTVILGANGPIPLIVPVEKGREQKICIKDLRIAYDEDWQRNHWRTIFSAYNSSPFFEYYADEIEPFFRRKHTFLFDFNHKIMETLIEILELPSDVKLTKSFEQVAEGTINLREKISPKAHLNMVDPRLILQPYTQVFSDKFGFTPNLSMLDLLFNEGPSAHSILMNSWTD